MVINIVKTQTRQLIGRAHVRTNGTTMPDANWLQSRFLIIMYIVQSDNTRNVIMSGVIVTVKVSTCEFIIYYILDSCPV